MRKMRITHGIYYAPRPGSKGFNRILLILFGSFAIVGLLFSVCGIIWLHTDSVFYHSARTVQGEIVEIAGAPNGGHRPIVRYAVDGAEYTVQLNNYTPSMQVGDIFPMYYAPDAPQKARNETYLGGTIFLCVGGGFFMFGAIGLCAFSVRKLKKRNLSEKGDVVSARVTAVVCVENLRVNGRTPYYLFCETNAVPALAGKRLKSRYVYEPLPQALVGTTVRVYVDPAKPMRYLVDTDSLQKGDNSDAFSV